MRRAGVYKCFDLHNSAQFINTNMASSIGLYTLKLLLFVGQATLTLALACPPLGSYIDLDPHPQNNLSAPALIDAAIWALGGRQALIDLQGVTYESEE